MGVYAPRPMPTLSPVLLLGAGTGEATCGILYLAGYLRRHDIEAYVQLWDGDFTEAELRQSLEGLLKRVRPKLVGISLKWFHHVHRALLIAKLVRKIDPTIRIVVGGNTASYWWRELHAYDTIDHLVLGDGEVPLLALCRGEENPPNCVARRPDGSSTRLPLQYVQSAANSEDSYYSHFDELFLSERDRRAYSGWVQPGRGCGENCLYCGGARGNQKAAFGRAKPFLRSEESVRRDHQEIVGHTWQLRYDFSGSTAEFLQGTWAGVDLSGHSCMYFLWGIARPELVAALAGTFDRVFMILDIGCFSESQRLEQMRRGLLKPCLGDRALMDLIAACRKFKNLEVEVSGIGGLPFASKKTLEEELRLVKRLTELDCVIGYQRLEAQPGALVTEHPGRFEMVTEARSFKEFLDYFERRDPHENTVPMVRFADAKLERAVQETSDEVDELSWTHRQRKRKVHVTPRMKLVNASASTREFGLAEWLGSHRVPAKLAKERVTVLRSPDGAGLSCAPSLNPRKFTEPSLAVGDDAQILLSTLSAFERPTPVSAAVGRLGAEVRLDPESAQEAIDYLVEGHFLRPA